MYSRQASRRIHNVRRHRLALALLGAMAMPALPALAQTAGCQTCLPSYGDVVSGSVTSNFDSGGLIRPNADASSSTMTITQTSRGAIINWGNFDIAANYSVNFVQPNGGVTLNRVVGFGPGQAGCNASGGCGAFRSYIDGSLSANGSVFFINPAGFTFGSGAAINVGSIVASTLDLADVDFLAGVDSGHFAFRATEQTDMDGDDIPDAYLAGAIENNATITTRTGGTVAFIGSSIDNWGEINAPGGSVVFGSAQQVTLDFHGDGLTMITTSGPALHTPAPSWCEFGCDPVPGQLGNWGSITADGGQILLRSAGDITNGGTLRARTLVNRAGRIELTAQGSVELGDNRDGYLGGGSIDVTGGAGLAGGAVVIEGTEVRLTSDPDAPTAGDASWIDASGGTHGGSVDIRSSTGTLLQAGTTIRADGQSGSGGTVQVSGPAIEIDAGSLVSASSSAGTGGRISLEAGAALAAYGRLQATGANAGGSIVTASGNSFDIRGLDVDAGSGGTAGTWTLWAPDITVTSGGATASLDSTDLGREVQDAEINRALNNGTSVTLRAGTSPSDSGDIHFRDGVAIVYDDGTQPLLLRADAQGSIYGSGFSIGSNAAALSMAFNADANNLNNGFGAIDFANATLDSNGGDIRFYGQSDAAGGAASSYASGVRLSGSVITSGGGDILIRGASTGADAGLEDAGVRLESTRIDAGAGQVAIHGTGANQTAGVALRASAIRAGDVAIDGQSSDMDGVLGVDSDIDASGGISIAGSGGAHGVMFSGDMRASGSGIAVTGSGGSHGVMFSGDMDASGGDIVVTGDGGADGVAFSGSMRASGGIVVNGSGGSHGVMFSGDMSASGGGIAVNGSGGSHGVMFSGDMSASGGGIAVTGDGDDGGVQLADGGVHTTGGAITITGTAVDGAGVQLGDGDGLFAIGSAGGAIAISGTGRTGGVAMRDVRLDSAGGDIDLRGEASGVDANGLELVDVRLSAASGDVRVTGIAGNGTGIRFAGDSGIATTTGDLLLAGVGAHVGLSLDGGEIATDSGGIDLRGRGLGATADGLRIGDGVEIATNGGGVQLAGEGGSGAGVILGSGARVSAGNSLVVVRAGNNGSSDAIRLQGGIHSAAGVNLRPGGVDANGGLTERVDDRIVLGGGSGFALDVDELARVSAPELVIGSNLHAGAIEVLAATTRAGNLTLQNDGGSGGIAIQAAIDVSGGTLALSSGGDIVQSTAGAITAHSLLARAGGDVLLASAANNVAATTLAGSAGGDFRYQDVDGLAIGLVHASGMDASANALSGLQAEGISASGDVFVRNLGGDMILGADVSGTQIDLVTANTLQNLAGAALLARGNWRVWANTWAGETRGGLAGDGSLPNLYGCAYLGQCGVTVPAGDNHFIYVQQPTAVITFDSFSREYGLANPAFTFTVSGAILGDSAANVATGSATTTATVGSNVGSYAISGNFTSAAGYLLQLVPGTLAVTPATLLFTADPFVRYLGTANPAFTGSITGFRNGDTVESVFGSDVVWSSPAGLLSPIGYYAITGGTAATNYVFAQAPGNATALQVIPLPQLSSTPVDLVRETINTYVYDRNFGGAPVCAINASLADQQLASSGDALSNEWSKVRSRPNLTSCFDTERKNSCGDF